MGTAEIPLVSIIIPAYMAAGRIRETLDSVFAQTYPNFEVILVNDGSPDAPALEQAIRGYGNRLAYLKQENQGPSGARNTAIRHARGKYIACLDSDDTYLPEHVATLVDLLEREHLDLAFSDSRVIRNGVATRAFEEDLQLRPITFERLLKQECVVATSATVASRQAMVDAGLFDERFRRCEDFDLWLRMAYRGAKMDSRPEIGVIHRLLPDGLSADNYLLKQGRIEVFQKTLKSLPLSFEQQNLIRGLIATTEGKALKDLAKKYLREGCYEEAAVAAEKASALLPDRVTQWTARALKVAPWALHALLRIREKNTARKRGVRGHNRDLELPKSSVQLQSKELVERSHG